MRLKILHIAANVVCYSRQSGTICKNLPKRRSNLFDAHPFGIGQHIRSPVLVQNEQNKSFRVRQDFSHLANQRRA